MRAPIAPVETPPIRDNATAEAIAMLGGPAAVARLRGVSAWAVNKWQRTRLPADQVLWLARQTAWQITPHQLAPAIYPNPFDGLPAELRPAKQRKRA